MRTNPKLILFDFDGTLADGFPGIAAAANAVRHRHGYPPLSIEEIKQYVGWGLDHLIVNVVPHADLEVDIPYYRQHYATTMLTGTHLLPGAREVVDRLHQDGRRLGVCSNKKRPFTEQLLELLQVKPPIEKVLGPDDVPNHKPAPDMILAAMEYFGTTPEQTLYIGDMEVDVLTGKAAGVQVWTVPTGALSAEQLRAAGAERILESLWDVLGLISPLEKQA
jgi:2-phosphoglycolate phosphatase